jgi:hypothetical protein
MQPALDPDLGLSTRLVMLDLQGPGRSGVDLDGLRGLLAAARARGLAVVHSYRGTLDDDPGVAPWRGLAPLPHEPVFMRSQTSAFSSRQFSAWAALSTGSLVFLGLEPAMMASARAAAALGHTAYGLIASANSNGAGGPAQQLTPVIEAAFCNRASDAFNRTGPAYFLQGAANGPR